MGLEKGNQVSFLALFEGETCQNVNRLCEKEKGKNLTISSLKGGRERRLHRWFGENILSAFSVLTHPLP